MAQVMKTPLREPGFLRSFWKWWVTTLPFSG